MKKKALRNQIASLKDTLPSERATKIDECLAEIARLSADLGHAVGDITAFDQRVYVEVSKGYLAVALFSRWFVDISSSFFLSVFLFLKY